MNNPEEKIKLKRKVCLLKGKTQTLCWKLGEKSDIYCLESLFAKNLTIISTNRLHAAA